MHIATCKAVQTAFIFTLITFFKMKIIQKKVDSVNVEYLKAKL